MVQPASPSPASSPLDDDEPVPPPDPPELDETLPLDEPDEPPLDEPPLDELLPLDVLNEPLLDEALPLDEAPPLDVDEPKLDEPSSVTSPESVAAPAPPSSPGRSEIPRSEPHPATRHRAGASAISHASLVGRSDRERRAGVTTSRSPARASKSWSSCRCRVGHSRCCPSTRRCRSKAAHRPSRRSC
jgi:hypothetical protein